MEAEHRAAAADMAAVDTTNAPCVYVSHYLNVRSGERSFMPRTNRKLDRVSPASFPKIAAVLILATGCFLGQCQAQQSDQKTFSSPDNASSALVAAVASNDEKTMLHILGPEGKQIVSSGDEIEDAVSRANFAEKYREMHRLVREPDTTTTLYIGADNWPTPIPLVKKGHLWYFDTSAGKQEILYRRIGRNELSAIRVCQELVAAQKEFHSAQNSEYAQKLFSEEGKHDGLYWKAAAGEAQSPIGPLVASAVAEGYPNPHDGAAPTPYRGYYYRILTSQAKTGAAARKSYIVDGKMTGGFAFLAYPAAYRSSGVVTFMVNQEGVVYEKDLGNKTIAVAKEMKEFRTNSGWQAAEDQAEIQAQDQVEDRAEGKAARQSGNQVQDSKEQPADKQNRE